VHRLWYLALAAAVVAGAWLRLLCLNAEFWLDEIWSLELGRAAGSWPGLFGLRHDNNHHLNTAWLLLCPAGSPWWAYRLHVLVAGLAAIALAARAALPWGRVDAVFAAWLVAGSFWLVLASAEARGYSLAVAFALGAFVLLRRYLDTGSWPARAGFWLASAAGFLSHLTFVHAYLGFVVWSMRRFARQRRSPGDEIAGLLRLHGPVAGFFLVFYLGSVRGMEVGGGPSVPAHAVLTGLVGLGLGGPGGGWPGLPWLLGAAVAFAFGLRLLARRGEDGWAFFATAVLAAPALFLARRPPFLFERYFLIPFVFFLLVLAHALAELYRQGGFRRVAAVALLLGCLAGTARHALDFTRAGRGRFHEALAWIADQDPGGTVTVTGDHDFRVGKYVRFYTGQLTPAREVRYLGGDEVPPRGGTAGPPNSPAARWLLVHRLDEKQERRPPPGETERDAAGQVYRLARAYPSRGPGCWGWYVYRR
jgi:hypothetical protein